MERSVVVIGLLPPQARRIASEFPGCGLKFIPRDREREVPALIPSFDHVVVMTKFISHATWFLVSKEKLVPVNGGLSSLRSKLRKLLVPIAKRVQTEQEVLESMPTLDYPRLKTAAPGEVITFAKPKSVKRDAFYKQVTAMRSYYKRHHHVESEEVKDGDIIRVTINGRRDPAPAVVAPKAAPSPIVATDLARQLWSEAYLRLITAQPGASDTDLAARADAAVAAFQARFPT